MFGFIRFYAAHVATFVLAFGADEPVRAFLSQNRLLVLAVIATHFLGCLMWYRLEDQRRAALRDRDARDGE